MAGVIPLFARFDHDDLPGHHVPQPAGAKDDDTVAPQQSAAGGPIFDREDDQFDGTAGIHLVPG